MIDLKESKRRLLKLADYLDTLTGDRFDYDQWVGSTWKGKQDLSCGATACALGHAATIPEFQALGLHLFKPPNSNGGRVHFNMVTDSISAGMDFFGLTHGQTKYLFIPGYSPSDAGLDEHYHVGPDRDARPWEVAKHIRIFVAAMERQ